MPHWNFLDLNVAAFVIPWFYEACTYAYSLVYSQNATGIYGPLC